MLRVLLAFAMDHRPGRIRIPEVMIYALEKDVRKTLTDVPTLIEIVQSGAVDALRSLSLFSMGQCCAHNNHIVVPFMEV